MCQHSNTPVAFCYFVQALKGENEFAVQGSVRVLKELSRDLTDSQIPALAPVILPDIYRSGIQHTF